MMATTSAERATILTVSRRAMETLRGSLADKPGDMTIETDVQSLQGLADVISRLLDEVLRCGGEECMGRSIDGVKLWVARDQYLALEQLNERHTRALRAIAEAISPRPDEMSMLIDWEETAQAFAATARAALE